MEHGAESGALGTWIMCGRITTRSVHLLTDRPAGAKAHIIFGAFSARLKPCPDTKQRLSAWSNSYPDTRAT